MKRYFEAATKQGWRRRIAPAVLIAGLLFAFKLTYDEAPREQSVQVHLSTPLRANLAGVRLTYLEDGEAITGSEQRFLDGAPAVVRSTPSLSPGKYQLDIELSEQTGAVTHHRREVVVPSDGTLRIHLDERP
jgi:hypothetical protein